jgi:YVTN family beta-propeller protein
LPTGTIVTPTAAPGSTFEFLNPGLPSLPNYVVDHAVSTALSPDGTTLLILTSGYNRVHDLATGGRVPNASNEYVFIYDLTGGPAVKRQVLQIPNTFFGLAWDPKGGAFYVSGGVDDVLHVFRKGQDGYAESLPAIALDHSAGLGLDIPATTSGVAISPAGDVAIVANYENDSVSVVDLQARGVRSEIELRPGKGDPAQRGVAGGEYPFGVIFASDSKAYVTSQRDAELLVLSREDGTFRVRRRVRVGGQPNKMIVSRDRSRLYVANANTDSVSVIDVKSDTVLEEIPTTGPDLLASSARGLKGANPNGLALSPDERVLYVTNGGTNSLAVVEIDGRAGRHSRVVGLIPTGWYPSDVIVSADGSRLLIVNAKGVAGPACLDVAPRPLPGWSCAKGNQYVWSLEKAGLLQLPVPGGAALARLTAQVALNNRFTSQGLTPDESALMARVRSTIRHVIYVIKENRTYDQVLGDLRVGNGDPALAMFPARITPNTHALSLDFVTLDRFYDSGESSGTGWSWTTAARTTDAVEKAQPVNYAGRGLAYDWEGTNRNVNIGLATLAQRVDANPRTPPDPDLLPGTADIAAPSTGAGDDSAYLWTAVLRKGLTVRNYGAFGDIDRYAATANDARFVPLDEHPFSEKHVQFFPAKRDLVNCSDPYFRGFDMKYPDAWRYTEWEREFDEFERRGDLPSLELVRFPHDHTGDFQRAIEGVDTPEKQVADNDLAVGLLVEKVSKSRYAQDTLIFVIEDDAQSGPDHVDAHRSTLLVAGSPVKRSALVSTPYSTVSVVRTIEEILGVEPLGLTDAFALPMAELFRSDPQAWAYRAIVPDILRTTGLALPEAPAASAMDSARPRMTATHGPDWWSRAMSGQRFDSEDKLDTEKYNRVLWRGLMGSAPYPAVRGGRDLSQHRERLPGVSREP